MTSSPLMWLTTQREHSYSHLCVPNHPLKSLPLSTRYIHMYRPTLTPPSPSLPSLSHKYTLSRTQWRQLFKETFNTEVLHHPHTQHLHKPFLLQSTHTICDVPTWSQYSGWCLAAYLQFHNEVFTLGIISCQTVPETDECMCSKCQIIGQSVV